MLVDLLILLFIIIFLFSISQLLQHRFLHYFERASYLFERMNVNWQWICSRLRSPKRRYLSVSISLSQRFLIILHIDTSTTIEWGAVMSQLQEDGKLHPAHFESGIWSDAERKYDALKLECRALLKALKKFRF